MRFLLLVLAVIQFLFLPVTTPYAKERGSESVDKNIAQYGTAVIGDPKEIFLVKKKTEKENISQIGKRKDPATMSEFLAYLKKDFKQAGKELSDLKIELEKQKRHTFHDPDFIPPKRPDWR